MNQLQRATMVRVTLLVLLLFVQAKSQSSQIPKEVAAIAGTYSGEWTMYGMDEKGQIVKRAAWKDTLKAENPVVQGDRAFVTITDAMSFEGTNAPARTSTGIEGYLINKDGSLGDYFMEFGQTNYRMQRLGKDVWSYAVAASPQELASLGFTNVISGQHVMVKVVTYEQGTETHRITRLTTVNWKDAEGKDRWIQFVSLQGFHKRQR